VEPESVCLGGARRLVLGTFNVKKGLSHRHPVTLYSPADNTTDVIVCDMSTLKKQRQRRKIHSEGDGTITTSSPRYRTRSTTRSFSLSDQLSPIPTLDERHFIPPVSLPDDDVGFFSPGSRRQQPKEIENPFSPVLDASQAELSPIAKIRDSDQSSSFEEPSHDSHTMPSQRDEIGAVYRDGKRNAPAKETLTVATSGSEDEVATMPDLTQVRMQVGQSSTEFFERIRNAVHRRKVAMTRSRDSLVAKEEEQLRSNAELKDKAQAKTMKQPQDVNPPVKTNHDFTRLEATGKAFKARPLPPTTGILGSGGMEGVPKVEKKPSTTPFSPLLGSRRRQKPKIKALKRPKARTSKTPVVFDLPKPVLSPSIPTSKPKVQEPRPFKARAIPKVIRSTENGGQYGVPKVEKRPLTLAKSPLLGSRRRSRSANPAPTAPSSTMTTDSGRSSRLTRSLSTSCISRRTASAHSGVVRIESPSLLGLKLVATPTGENAPDTENVAPSKSSSWGYEPHSTRRAQKRAEYDIRRKTMFELKSAREDQEREREVRLIRRELNLMRKEL